MAPDASARRQARSSTSQEHPFFVGLLATGEMTDGRVFQRESSSSLAHGVSGGWEGPAAASNEQVARSQSYGFAARQLRKAMDRLRDAAEIHLAEPSEEHLKLTKATAGHIYPAAASLLRQLNFLAESLGGMLHDVERRVGHVRDADDGTATPLTALSRGITDVADVTDFRRFRDRLHAIAVEFDQLEAAKAAGKPIPPPVQVTLLGAVQPELEPIVTPMLKVERSIARTRRKYNDTCCALVHILGIPDLAVIIQAHTTVIDLYRCRRTCLGCKDWCDHAIKALPRLAFFDTKARRIETLSLAPGKIRWERPAYQPPVPDADEEEAAHAAQDQPAPGGIVGGNATARQNAHTGAAMCALNDGRFFLTGLKALEQTGAFADDNHIFHHTWQQLDRVQLYDPREEIEGPSGKRWCFECHDSFRWHGVIEDAHNDVCPKSHPKRCYTSRDSVPNPNYRAWKPVPPAPTPRACAQVVTLADGRVLMLGGRIPFTNPEPDQHNGTMTAATIKALSENIGVTTCECYDPATNTWSTLAPMHTPRRNAAVGLLPDGTVVIAGGCSPKATRPVNPNPAQPAVAAQAGAAPAVQSMELTVPHPVALKTVETYNPQTNRWCRHAVKLEKARAFCSGLVLPDGSFGVLGGGVYEDEATPTGRFVAPITPIAQATASRDMMRPPLSQVPQTIEVLKLPKSAALHGPWYGAPDVKRLSVSNAASTCIGGCLAAIAYKVIKVEEEPVEYEYEHERVQAEAAAEAEAKRLAGEAAEAAAAAEADGDGTDKEDSGTGLWDVQSEDHYSNVETQAEGEDKMRIVKLFGTKHTYLCFTYTRTAA